MEALGIATDAFDALPNLYAKYGRSIREVGPRLWSASWSDPGWDGLFDEAFERQAASFLVVPQESASLESHLLGLVRMPQPDGGSLLFRFQDVVVLTALAPLLAPEQRHALLGPALCWLAVDLCHGAVSIERPRRDARRVSSLHLEQVQIDALGKALVPLTIIYQANETDTTLLAGMSKCEQVKLIVSRMKHAERQGLARDEDVALYCVLSLQLPEGFDKTGPVAEALQDARDRGISFGEAIDDVPVDRWREWDEELDRQGFSQHPIG